MAYQLGDIVTRVQRRIRDTGYSTAEIKDFINDTQNDVFNEYRLPFMQATQPYTLEPDVSDITNGLELPANFVQAIDLTLTSSGKERLLEYKDVREIDGFYPDPDDTAVNTAGVPDQWYIYGQIIKVFPVPDEAYTVSLRYYKKPTLLTADADVPEIPSEFEEVLVVGAAYRVMQVKDNYDQAGILQNKYDEVLQKLVVKYSLAQVGAVTRMRINRRAVGKTGF